MLCTQQSLKFEVGSKIGVGSRNFGKFGAWCPKYPKIWWWAPKNSQILVLEALKGSLNISKFGDGHTMGTKKFSKFCAVHPTILKIWHQGPKYLKFGDGCGKNSQNLVYAQQFPKFDVGPYISQNLVLGLKILIQVPKKSGNLVLSALNILKFGDGCPKIPKFWYWGS